MNPDPYMPTPEQAEVFATYLRSSPSPEVLMMQPESDKDYIAWGRWVEAVCLAFGAAFETAARVAALFVEGIRKSRR